MPTDFEVTIRAAGGDYTTPSAAEAANQCDLTAATTKVFSHGGITGAMPDGSGVTGKTSGATGTMTHATSGQILIHTIAGGPFQSGEQVFVNVDANYVVISDAGDSPRMRFTPYNDWPNGIIDDMLIAGYTGNPTNYVIYQPAAGHRHTGIMWSNGNLTGFGHQSNGNWTEPIDGLDFDTQILDMIVTHGSGSQQKMINLPGVRARALRCIAEGGGVASNACIQARGTQAIAINNIVYDAGWGIRNDNAFADDLKYYNNTVINCVVGIESSSGAAKAGFYKNNLVQNCTTAYVMWNPQQIWEGNLEGGTNQQTDADIWTSVTKISSGATTGTSAGKLVDGGATFETDGVIVGMRVKNTTDTTWATVTAVDSQTELTLDADIFTAAENYEVGDAYCNASVTFVDAPNDNYQLDAGDSGAIGKGIDLSADLQFPFSDDIVGSVRTDPWDIGAWKAPEAPTPPVAGVPCEIGRLRRFGRRTRPQRCPVG